MPGPTATTTPVVTAEKAPPAVAAAASRHAVHLVTPSMCGHNSLLIGRLGDWTWDLVSEASGVDVLRARDARGEPAYLSFCYYRVVGSRRFHLRSPQFGDWLSVDSRVFGLGGESVVTLHQVRLADDGPADADPAVARGASAAHTPHTPDRPRPSHAPVDEAEFFAFADPDCLYVEHYNRWVSRAGSASNRDLSPASPPGFRAAGLGGTLDPRYSPREPFRRALTTGTPRPEPTKAVERLSLSAPVDITRDLNGAGLLYFASYFSLADRALLAMWRHLGRSTSSFLNRVVIDQQMCLFGNADADTVLETEIGWGPGERAGCEQVDISVFEQGTRRPIAACSLDLEYEAEDGIRTQTDSDTKEER